jgi:hypothetical protein
MALKVQKQAAIPAGNHQGIITRAHETTKVFDPAKGPEPVVEIVIQPAWKQQGYETLPVAVVFSPVLNGLSALSKFLGRIGQTPTSDEFVIESIEGTEVLFTAKVKTGSDGFVQIEKDSIRKA